MENVGQARIENFTDVFIVEGVEHLAALAARLHEVRRAQDSQLVAHHGLFEPEHVGNVVHRDIVLHQELDNADSRRIAENAEEFRKFEQGIEIHVLHRLTSQMVHIPSQKPAPFRPSAQHSLLFLYMNTYSCFHI